MNISGPAKDAEPHKNETIIETIERLAKHLQAERGVGVLTRKELIESVIKERHCAPSSVIPPITALTG